MKLNLFSRFKKQREVVVVFGRAQLIRHPDGKMELRGGTREDRLHVQEWISIFMHEAVIRN